MKEFNFTFNTKESDIDLFFSPITDKDVFIQIQPNWTMANIMVASGIFSSLTQARRNGFGMEIPEGFSDRFVGKLKKRITILNIKI